jgi:hypothetical protein
MAAVPKKKRDVKFKIGDGKFNNPKIKEVKLNNPKKYNKRIKNTWNISTVNYYINTTDKDYLKKISPGFGSFEKPSREQIPEKTFLQTFLSFWGIIVLVAFITISTLLVWLILMAFFDRLALIFNKSSLIKVPPISLLLKVADLLPKKYRDNLTQEVSDMCLEYYEALDEKNIWRARFIVAFYYVGLSWSVVMWISDKVKEVVGIIPKKN